MKRVYHPPKLSSGYFASTIIAIAITLFIFTAIPFSQFLTKLNKSKETIMIADVQIPPPESIPPEPLLPKKEELAENKPILKQNIKPLNLSQLDIFLNPGLGDALNIGFELGSFGFTPDTVSQMNIFELKDLDNNPRSVYRVKPIYPYNLKRERINGKVELLLLISENGTVIEATVNSSTLREFEKPAVEAALKWKFEPGRKNGEAVRFKRLLPISFIIQ